MTPTDGPPLVEHPTARPAPRTAPAAPPLGHGPTSAGGPLTVLSVFGTRPEIIKMAPVIAALEQGGGQFRTINVSTGQHIDLLRPFVKLFGTRIDHDLQVMQPGQTPAQVCGRVLHLLEPLLIRERPDVLLVQGDTTTALAGALAAFYQRVPVGHVEAGLRTDDPMNPYPEEMNRRMITRVAAFHFAATEGNRANLLAEGVDPERIAVTGNPVVDSLYQILERLRPSPPLAELLERTRGLKRVAVTTHRRESFGAVLADNLRALRGFVERHDDVCVIFPVHPNPAVRAATSEVLAGVPRVHLLEPLDYLDFIALLAESWLIASDSGGVQEEAPTLGKPLLVLRANTERPEAVQSGVARLVGDRPGALADHLERAYRDSGWHETVARRKNPFGEGESGARILMELSRLVPRR